MSESRNEKVYIHEYIDIIGHNRVNYMHHMTANWSPIAQEERQQLCYGVWAVIGTTRGWPEVVNLWEEDGFPGLADSLDRECNNPSIQDPKLIKWWSEAANYRRHGDDRILVPAPWTRTIEQLCAEGVHGDLYAHEHIDVPQGTAVEFLDIVRNEAAGAYAKFGWELIGAWWTAMVGEREAFLLWSIPTFAQWGEAEDAQRTDPALAKWREREFELATKQHRFLLVDAPLSPLRLGRQPARSDRHEGWEDLEVARSMAAEETHSLLFERDGPTVVLTMNRPERRNALSIDMIVRLADAWETVDADDTIRAVILTGADGAYCVGGDMASGWMAGNRATDPSDHERRAQEDPSLLARGLLLYQWLRTPIIAAVNGDCMGGGCEMLQQTDIRIAEEHARFGVPEARRGLMAGAGSTMRLKRQIPYAVALEMLITGRILDAEEALRWGLVTHVVPKGKGLDAAREIAAVIAANAPLSVAASKASAIETGWLPEEEARPIEGAYAARVSGSNDAKEGMLAFIEKRPPNFTGT